MNARNFRISNSDGVSGSDRPLVSSNFLTDEESKTLNPPPATMDVWVGEIGQGFTTRPE